jgi:hypothetical protein
MNQENCWSKKDLNSTLSTSFDDTIGDWVIELLYIDFKNATWQ